MKKDTISVKFWGVRGSYPVADKNFLEFGGNTSCVEIKIGTHKLILDGGTGIIPLGDRIFAEYIASSSNVYDRKPMNITILLSHVHQDHIQGLNFFKPINVHSTKMSILGYSGFDSSLDETLAELIYGKSFPINLYDINADCVITDVADSYIIILDKDGERPTLKRISSPEDLKPKKDEIIISALKLNSHPNYGVMSYKIAYKDKTIVYATDTECYQGGSKKLELFAKDADLLIHDSQYTTEDYLSNVFSKQGFGHSTFEMAYNSAVNSNAKRLAFFHFDPSYNDQKLTKLEKIFKNKNENYFLAKEGLEICI